MRAAWTCRCGTGAQTPQSLHTHGDREDTKAGDGRCHVINMHVLHVLITLVLGSRSELSSEEHASRSMETAGSITAASWRSLISTTARTHYTPLPSGKFCRPMPIARAHADAMVAPEDDPMPPNPTPTARPSGPPHTRMHTQVRKTDKAAKYARQCRGGGRKVEVGIEVGG